MTKTQDSTSQFGNDPDIADSPYYRGHIIGQLEQSAAGNLVIRAGEQNQGGKSWMQTLHIVLTPEEARELVRQINAMYE